MDKTENRSTELNYGALLRTPCCLVNGDTVNIGEPQTGEVCVVLGSGQGESVIKLADSVGDSGFVFIVEVSKEMLRRSRWWAEAAGVKNVEFVHSIFEDIEIGDNVVNLLISNCSIARARDKQRVWNEIHRILKPGGRFVVSDIFSDEPIPRMRRTSAKIKICPSDLKTKEEYLVMLDRMGFTHIIIVEESVPHPAVYMRQKVLMSSFIVAGQRPLLDCRDECL